MWEKESRDYNGLASLCWIYFYFSWQSLHSPSGSELCYVPRLDPGSSCEHCHVQLFFNISCEPTSSTLSPFHFPEGLLQVSRMLGTYTCDMFC